MINKNNLLKLIQEVIGITGLALCSLSYAQESGNSIPDSFVKALTDGKVSLLLNYRYEYADDPTKTNDAHASTLRTVLGYQTGRTHGLAGYVEVENVHVIGNELYNSGSNGKVNHSVVVDPQGTELNQAYISFAKEGRYGIPLLKDTEIRAGRQLISYRNAPAHRFVGPVVWRQNWQSFDGFTLNNTSLADTRIHMSYIYNINRIFGDDHPAMGDKDVDGYMFNVQYTGFPLSKLEVYAHLLDFKNTTASPAFGFYQSTDTFGVRFNGSRNITDKAKLIYAAEYAHQSDAHSNPHDIDSDYFLGELALAFDLDGEIVQSATIKGGYELLSGDGGADRFTTPLATLHAYQGWADKFLNTPGDGIKDIYVFANTKVFSGYNLTMVYHDLSSDNDGYDYGTEFDIVLSKSFKKYFTAGIKYADYDADSNALNLVRNANAGQSNDVGKLWAFLRFKY